jgi:hypothetical protein
MNNRLKSRVYLFVFITAAGILGWGVWFNYRPQAIYAGCLDIADRTQSIHVRYNIENDSELNSDVLHNCLQDAGYYNN